MIFYINTETEECLDNSCIVWQEIYYSPYAIALHLEYLHTYRSPTPTPHMMQVKGLKILFLSSLGSK